MKRSKKYFFNLIDLELKDQLGEIDIPAEDI